MYFPRKGLVSSLPKSSAAAAAAAAKPEKEKSPLAEKLAAAAKKAAAAVNKGLDAVAEGADKATAAVDKVTAAMKDLEEGKIPKDLLGAPKTDDPDVVNAELEFAKPTAPPKEAPPPPPAPEEQPPPPGLVTYEALLKKKLASEFNDLVSKGWFCLGHLKDDVKPDKPDKADWAFSRRWHLAFVLAHRIAPEGRISSDRATGGWVFHEPGSDLTIRIGNEKNELLAEERAFKPDAELRWQEGLKEIWVVVKQGETKYEAKLTLPDRKRDVKPSSVIILLDPKPFSREEP